MYNRHIRGLSKGNARRLLEDVERIGWRPCGYGRQAHAWTGVYGNGGATLCANMLVALPGSKNDAKPHCPACEDKLALLRHVAEGESDDAS